MSGEGPPTRAQPTSSAGTAGAEPEIAPAAPPPSVRVRTETLDRFLSSVGEVILNSSQLRTAAGGDGERQSRLSAGLDRERQSQLSTGLDRMDRAVGDLQLRALELRTTPLVRILEPLPRMARDVATRMGKRVEVEIRGAELELDRSILDRLSDPLVHVIRNAVDHGIEAPAARVAAGKAEAGRIQIEARREKDSIRISVCDDGAGVDLERVRVEAVENGLVHADIAEDLPPDELAAFLFHPGLSTAREVSEISGRGVGMDAVRTTIESLGGGVDLLTEWGVGTTTTLRVPVTAAVQRVLLLGVQGEVVALPIGRIERIVEVSGERVERAGSESFALIDDVPVPVLHLASELSLGAPPEACGEVVTLVLTDVRGERVGLRVERLAGHQQIYVKPVPELLAPVRALAGLTILGDGRPVFVLDPNQLA